MCKKIVLFIVTVLTLVSCSSSKSVIVTTKSGNSKNKSVYSSNKSTSGTKKETNSGTTQSASKTVKTTDVTNAYILQYKSIAMSNMKKYGIPASIILAQGILESGSGQSNLALNANNHFGIKCAKDWNGETVYQDDDVSQECFRKYRKSEESYQDHADFISQRTRYASLFDLKKGDYKGWAKGLRAAGYATDPNYPEKLISYIESYQLDQYDNIVLGKDYVLDKSQVPQSTVAVTKGANQYVVEQGDTLYSISKKFNISVEELKRQNNLFDNAISVGQTILIK